MESIPSRGWGEGLGGGRVVLTSGTGRPRNWRVGGGRGGGAGLRTDGVREKFTELAGVERGGGEAYKSARQYYISVTVYRRNCSTCVGCLGRRSTPHMRMDWGYTVPYIFKQRAENPPEYEKP